MKANQLASILQSKVCFKRNYWRYGRSVIRNDYWYDGDFKSRATYLPIDPNYPTERIEYMLQDSQAKYLLSKRTEEVLPQFAGEVLYLDKEYLFKVKKVI